MWKSLRDRLAGYLKRGSTGRAPGRPGPPVESPGPPAGAAVAPRPRPEAPRNRAGLPVIDPRSDLAALMGVGGDPPDEGGAPPLPPQPPSEGEAAGRRRPASGGPIRRNRLGIPVLDPGRRLDDLFAAGDPPEGATPPPASGAGAPESRREGGRPRNRHGLPQLEAGADLDRLLDPSAAGEDGDFARLLEEDLRGVPPEALRRRKSDRPRPSPLPLAKRLARYPHPQRQLDLHGCTAAMADRRTRDFLQDARRQGLWTVRIIVGRGRHSEAGPVLPDVVEDRLVALRRTGGILAYRWDRREKRRSGAVIVFLEGGGTPPG